MAQNPSPDRVTTPIDDREDRHDEFLSDSKKCPECGEAIENVRTTCPNCGYEYSAKDYDDDSAGREFMAGAQIDDEGNEVLDDDDDDDDTSDSGDSISSDSGDSVSSDSSSSDED